MLTGEVERDMICVGDGIEPGRLLYQSLDTVEMAVDDCMDEGCEVVVIDEVDGLRCD